MARYNNPHSRLVATAKLVLPLLSLGLLATLFLFARSDPHEMSIPFATVDIETLAREQRLDGPAFATVTEDGTEIHLTADTVRPDLSDSEVVNSRSISGGLKYPDGSSIDMQAESAVIDGPSRIAELAGRVVVETNTGFTVRTDQVAAMLDVSRIESTSPIEATGPLGEFNAGRMIVSQNPETGTYLLVFQDGVKLIYNPKN